MEMSKTLFSGAHDNTQTSSSLDLKGYTTILKAQASPFSIAYNYMGHLLGVWSGDSLGLNSINVSLSTDKNWEMVDGGVSRISDFLVEKKNTKTDLF